MASDKFLAVLNWDSLLTCARSFRQQTLTSTHSRPMSVLDTTDGEMNTEELQLEVGSLFSRGSRGRRAPAAKWEGHSNEQAPGAGGHAASGYPTSSTGLVEHP